MGNVELSEILISQIFIRQGDEREREREREREEEGRDGIWGCELTEEGKSNWNGEEWETEYFNSRNSDRITIV